MVTSNKLILYSTHIEGNGAGIAASRWIKALKVEIFQKKTRELNFIKHAFQRTIEKLLWNEKLVNSFGPASISIFGSQKINPDYNSLFFIHWVQGEFLSVWQLFKIRKKSIFYLHDQWMFIPIGHYSASNFAVRFFLYPLNTLLYLLKKQIMREAKGIMVPSQWMRDELLSIDSKASISVIPNPIPSDYFQSYDKNRLRKQYGIPAECKVVIFSTTGGKENVRKGNHIVDILLAELIQKYGEDNFKILIIGTTSKLSIFDRNVQYIAFTKDERKVAEIIAMADVCISLSRNDNFPQFTTQSQSLGVRVVSFDVGGCKETIIDNGTSGYIVKYGEISEMVDKIILCFNSDGHYSDYQKQNIRKMAFEKWHEESIRIKFEKIIGSYT